MSTAQQKLADLIALVKPLPLDLWHEYADVIKSGMLVGANAHGFAVEGTSGRIEVSIPGGLTTERYDYLSRFVTDEEKGILARGVLEKMLNPISWQDWDAALYLLRQTYGIDEERWLPGMIRVKGFDAIASEMRQKLSEYRKNNPPSRARLVVVETPAWFYGPRLLVFGNRRWHFREDAEVILTLLNQLEKNNWEPVFLSDPRAQGTTRIYFDPEQVRDAAKGLKSRTLPNLDWHAATDGTLFWSIP